MTLPAGLARILPMLATLALLVAAITVVSPRGSMRRAN